MLNLMLTPTLLATLARESWLASAALKVTPPAHMRAHVWGSSEFPERSAGSRPGAHLEPTGEGTTYMTHE